MKNPLQHWFEILDKQVAQLKTVCVLTPQKAAPTIDKDLLALPDSDFSSSQPMAFDHLIAHLKLGWSIVQSNNRSNARSMEAISSLATMKTPFQIDIETSAKADNKQPSPERIEFSEEDKALAKALKDSRKVWWEKENKQTIFSCLAIDVIRSHRRLAPMFGEDVVACSHPPIPTVDELREHFRMLAMTVDPSTAKEMKLITDISSFVSVVTKTVKSGHERIYGGLSVLLSHVESALEHSRPALARRKKSK